MRWFSKIFDIFIVQVVCSSNLLTNISLSQGCFFRQFFRSVNKSDYLTLRNGFIAVSFDCTCFCSLFFLTPFSFHILRCFHRFTQHLEVNLTSRNISKGHQKMTSKQLWESGRFFLVINLLQEPDYLRRRIALLVHIPSGPRFVVKICILSIFFNFLC